MICSNCNFNNPDSAKFCLECGNKFEIQCVNCGFKLPSIAKFCLECGNRVETIESSQEISDNSQSIEQYIPRALLQKMKEAETTGGLRNERKIVTMLFCDIQGSTAAAENLDPEEWLEIMNGAYEFMIQPVYKYEGVIARIMGDAILAFFGAPISHEDDPERAVLTGLEIIDKIKPYLDEIEVKWDLRVDVRIGINTGLVVVGEMGSDLRVEYSAAGDAINLASRMESTAKPGTLQVSEYTLKLVEPLFEFEEIGLLDVKGKKNPVKTYKIIKEKEKRELTRGLKGLDSPLVGRDEEFDNITGSILKIIDNNGQIISIMGDAGLGKSRLLRDIKDQLNGEGKLRSNPILEPGEENKILWLEGASLSYQTNSPYSPFKQILSSFLGIDELATNDLKYRNLKKTLAKNEIEEDYIPYLANLLDITPVGGEYHRIAYLEPPILRQKIYDVCSLLFRKWCQNSPLAIIFDDIHWIDNSSMKLLKSLFNLTIDNKIAFILMFRPRKEDPSWKIHEYLKREFDYMYNPITLAPLNHSEARFLVFNILKIEGLSEKVRNLILDKSEGNPFYLEEVIRSLIDQNLIDQDGNHWKEIAEIDDLSIPNTLSGVLTTRLDKLDEKFKRTLQTASVIGKEFSVKLLEELTDDSDSIIFHLAELEKKEFIQSSSKGDKKSYIFKHPLMKEAAYNSVLLKSRKGLHLSIAKYFEKNSNDNYHDIAYHYYRAQEFDKAIPFLIKAGNQAFRRYSTEEAIEIYKQAESLLKPETDVIQIHDLYQGLGETYLFNGQPDDSIRTYNNLIQVAEDRNHIECKVNGLNQLGFAQLLGKGEFEEAIESLQSAEKLALNANYEFGIAQNYMIMCNVETATAQFESVEKHLQQVADIGEKLEQDKTFLFGRSHITNTYYYTRRFTQCIEYGLETVRFAKDKGDKSIIAELFSLAIPMSYVFNGDLQKAWEVAMEGYKVSSEIYLPTYISFSATTLSEICLIQGKLEEARNFAMIAKEISNEIGLMGFRSLSMACDLFVNLELGSDEYIIENLVDDLEFVFSQPMGSFLKTKYLVIIGNKNLKEGKFEKAETHFVNALNEPGTLMYVYQAQALLGRATCSIAFEKLDDAKSYIIEARDTIEKTNSILFKPLLLQLESKIDIIENNNESAKNKINEAIVIATNYEFNIYLPLLANNLLEIANELHDENMKLRAKNLISQSKNQILDTFVNEDLKNQYLNSLNLGTQEL